MVQRVLGVVLIPLHVGSFMVPITSWEQLVRTAGYLFKCHPFAFFKVYWLRNRPEAVKAGTATEEQQDMVQAPADGLANTHKTFADARAAVKAGTATEEQQDLVQARAKNLAAGTKAMKAKSVAAAIAAGKPMRRCNGADCTNIGPEGRQHKHYANGQEKHCGLYRLPV